MARKYPERLVVNRPPTPDPCAGLPVMAKNDGLGLGNWVVRVKHTYLCKYIDSARGAAGSPKWTGGWVYLDPFCGPGRIRIENESFDRPGGVVAAWEQSKFSGVPFRKVLIGDLDKGAVDACEARLRAVGAPVTAFKLPAVESVKEMVQHVPERALCLAYIDPFKISVLDFEIFRTLAALRADLVVNFFSSDLRRNVDSTDDALNPGWRSRMPADLNRASLAAEWFDDWQHQVQALGFKMARAMQTAKNSKNSEMYKLVFFAKDAFPVGLWDDVAADPTGDLFPDL